MKQSTIERITTDVIETDQIDWDSLRPKCQAKKNTCDHSAVYLADWFCPGYHSSHKKDKLICEACTKNHKCICGNPNAYFYNLRLL